MASHTLTAAIASNGCNIPFKIIFSFVRDLIFAIVSQFKVKSLFFKYDTLSFGPSDLTEDIYSKRGNSYLELSNLYMIYFLRVPSTWASTVITSPSKLFLYAIYINFKFSYQSLHR